MVHGVAGVDARADERRRGRSRPVAVADEMQAWLVVGLGAGDLDESRGAPEPDGREMP
ncbi:hypothetical protein GCM10010411_72220 [Actinomadura fulvescens]|uniref:Uncharacterized protein n=1 Tax=Actinomadura fulvescens TaxID=46160 RepID=A0ABP6CU99_9ACTN